MNGLLEQLLALCGALEPCEGVPQESLTEARMLLAASLVQQNPALLPLQADASFPAAINEAAQAGVALAAERSAAGVRLRFLRQAYLAPNTDPGLPTRIAGPFTDGDGSLVELRFFESQAMRALLRDIPFVPTRQTLLLLPTATEADAASRVFTIPPGTVWIAAALLVPGTVGFAALRVDGGTLETDHPAFAMADGNLEIADGIQWTLNVQPQAAPASDAGAGDGNALALLLPTRLVVRSIGGPGVEGPIGIDGFGSALQFDTPSGAPVAADSDIVFAYDAGANAAAWAVDGQRSVLLDLEGDSTVRGAFWALPRSQRAPQDAGESANGGRVGVVLQGDVGSGLAHGPGRLQWHDCTLLADAQGLDLRCRRGEASARLPMSLWGQARTDVDLGPDLRSLRYASRRDGAELVAASGGRLRNRWDLPRDAAGTPFGCDAALDAFSLIIEPQGLRRVGMIASVALPGRGHGLVLENAYLSVTPVRRLALSGSGTSLETVASGLARLDFDVLMGEPMLPDPYAASWAMPGQLHAAEGGLSVKLRWSAEAAPAVQVQLERRIDYPEPRTVAAESDLRLGERFRLGLGAKPEFLGLLDLSTRDHHFGVAIESLAEQTPVIDDANRLTLQLRNVRLLMQPQVHWEPVQDLDSPVPGGTRLQSVTHGGRTLMGADSEERVPLLPGAVGRRIVAAAASGRRNAAALFSLPFGLRAYVHLDRIRKLPVAPQRVTTQLHEPVFDGLGAAQQIRLRATGVDPRGVPDPGRTMPGALHQTLNLTSGDSVLPKDVVSMFEFDERLPLHAVDLSGYGLSCFSHWRREPKSPSDDAVGVTQVQFDVLIGRTAYELIEVRSVLAPCQARVVRTVVLERRNSGRVQRFDSGWQAVDDGLFNRYVPFETGPLKALRNIRRIREQLPGMAALTLSDTSVWRPVLFDADAQIDDLIAGGAAGSLPALDHVGYIQIRPVGNAKPGAPPELPGVPRMQALFEAVGGTIGGAIDGRNRLGGTLEMHLHALKAALATDDVGRPGFVVATYGSPVLPRAGRWSAVRIDTATADVSPVDVQHGMPVVQRPGEAFRFVDPTQAHKNAPAADYGLLVSTDDSRLLFPRPTVGGAAAQRGVLRTAPPLMADAVALVHASGQFPRSAFVLQGSVAPAFEISSSNEWRLPRPDFPFVPPLPDLATGAGWSVQRLFGAGGGPLAPFTLQLDSALAESPLQMRSPSQQLKLDIPGFGTVLTMDGSFESLSKAAAGLVEPAIVFGPALDDLKSVVDSLGFFDQLPAGLVVQIDVDVDTGPNPGFSVHLNLKFSIGGGPEGRIDIGVGKFFGEFELDARFGVALAGKTGGRLSLVFQGDVQQGILPPLLYAGGFFRFAIEVGDSGKPEIELGLGTVTSIGGDLIGGLLALEATVKYGYLLVPETLKPGVLLGVDARAQLLAGLFSMSFSAEALARIERFNREDKTVTIFADIHVAGRVQVAVFFEESRSFETQFEQRVPLGPLLLVAGANPLLAAVIPLVL